MLHFSSDFHIYHKNVLNYCPETRAAANGDILVMNQLILDGINKKVKSSDTLYILGDVSITSNPNHIKEFFDNVKCRDRHLILGNHDNIFLKHKELQNLFVTVSNYKEIKYNHQLICMMHFPIESWNGKHRNSLMFHGHMHSMNGKSPNPDRKMSYHKNRMDVGIDSRMDFSPWSIDEILEFIESRND